MENHADLPAEVVHDCKRRIIDTIEAPLSGHRMVVDLRVIEEDWESCVRIPTETGFAYLGFYQLSRITKEKGCLRHYDRLDAVALGVAYWQKALGRDVGDAVAAARKKAHEEQLREFVRSVKGGKKQRPNWCRVT